MKIQNTLSFTLFEENKNQIPNFIVGAKFRL